MSVERNLEEIYKDLKSTKKKDRGKALEAVLILIKQESARRVLSLSLLDDQYSWDYLFLQVNAAIRSEISSRAPLPNKQYETIREVVLSIAQYSNGSIATSSIVSSVFAVYNSEESFSALGLIYLDLICNHLLNHAKHRAQLSPFDWQDLLDLARTVLSSKQNVNNTRYLELLCEIVTQGKHYSLGISQIKNLLVFLKNMITSDRSPSHTFDWLLLKLTNEALQSVAVESRYSAAEFTESTIRSVMNMYEIGKEKNRTIFRFFSIAVSIHHPQGFGPDDQLSYAHDWCLWKEQIREIHDLCQTEIREVFRRKDNYEMMQEFMNLLIDVAYLISMMPHSREGAIYEPECSLTASTIVRKRKSVDYSMTQTQKRARMEGGIVHVLCQMNASDGWFWLRLLKGILLRYPQFLDREYSKVLNVVCNLLCESRDPDLLDPLSRCAQILLEKKIGGDSTSQDHINSITSSWDKVADSITRNISKNNDPEQHLVLQSIIRNTKWKDVAFLLQLYVDGSIVAAVSSQQTLIEILRSGVNVDSEKRSNLIRWCLADIVNARLSASLVVLLLGKDVDGSGNVEPESHEVNSFANIYQVLNLTTFEEVQREETSNRPNAGSYSIHSNLVPVLIDSLTYLCNELIDDLTSNNTSLTVCRDVVSLLEVILRILSSFWSYNEFSSSALLGLVESLFRTLVITSTEMDDISLMIRTELFGQLYALDIHPEVHQLIRRQQEDLEIVRKIYCLWENYDSFKMDSRELGPNVSSQTEGKKSTFVSAFSKFLSSHSFDQSSSILHRNALKSECDKFQIDATDMLCHFINCHGELNSFQKLLADKVLNALKECFFILDSGPQLQIHLRVVFGIGTNATILCDTLNNCLDMLLIVTQNNHLHYEVLPVILFMIRKLLPTIYRQGDESTLSKFRTIMESCKSAVAKKNALLPIRAYIMLVSEIYSTDNTNEWTVWQNGTEMYEEIFCYLTHELIEVRTFAAQEIGNCFRRNNLQHRHGAKIMLRKLKERLSESQDAVDGYEKQSHVATCLIALSKVLGSSTGSRLDVAYIIIQIMSMNHFVDDDIKRFLKLASIELKGSATKYFVRHLKKLLTRWLSDGKSIENFPFTAFECNSRLDFYAKYSADITAVCSQLRKTSIIESIASKLKSSVGRLVESAFPMLEASVRLSGSLDTYMSSVISEEREEQLLTNKLASILYQLVRNADDPSSMVNGIRTFTIQDGGPLLLYLSTNNASIIQRVLLKLEGDIVNSVTNEDATTSVRRYVWFVTHYMDSTKDSQFQIDMSAYVTRDAFSVMLRAIRNSVNIVPVECACDCLRHILDTCPDSLKTELDILLPGVVNALTSVAISHPFKAKTAIALLEHIVIDNCDKYSDVIRRLDPFPDDEHFSRLLIRRDDLSLVDELYQFSEVAGHSGRRVGGLTRLLNSLSTRKSDLCDIYNKLHEMRGFAEDCSKSVLHKVIHQLVGLCSHKDAAVRLEAAKCLGELGPADLTTLVLQPDDAAQADESCAEFRLVDTVTVLLGQLMQQESFEVKAKASKALYTALRCEGGVSQCSIYYAPFVVSECSTLQLATKTDEAPPLEIWIPSTKTRHEEWIIRLAQALLSVLHDSMRLCDVLSEVCNVHAPFAEKLLPIILNAISACGTNTLIEQISQSITEFLSRYIQNEGYINASSVRCMVEVLDYIRTWEFRSKVFKSKLNVDCLLIAEAASRCKLYFTSILYAELWYEEQKDKATASNPSLTYLSVDDIQERSGTLSTILRHFYDRIGIQDGLHGCGMAHLIDTESCASHLEQLGRWDLCLTSHDATRNVAGEVRALRHFGLYNAISYVPSDTSTRLECAVRLCDWNYKPPSDAPSSYNLHHFEALKANRNGDNFGFQLHINSGFEAVISNVNNSTIESTKNLYEHLSQLQCLREMSNIAEARQKNTFDDFAVRWSLQDSLLPSDFSLQEAVLTSRCVMLKEEFERGRDSQLKELLSGLYLRLIKLARHNGKQEVALRNVSLLKKIDAPKLIQLEGNVEEARALWDKGEQKIALYLLSTVMKNLDQHPSSKLQAHSLRIYSQWLVQRKEKNARKIIEDYFLKATHLSSEQKEKLNIYNCIARFADVNYVQVKEYSESRVFETKKILIMQQRNLLTDFRREMERGVADRDKQQAIHLTAKQCDIDSNEVEDLEEECNFFLLYAVEFYLLCLREGDQYDHVVFRLVSLWLNNAKNSNVIASLTKILPTVPSRKFVGVLPQISPRMSDVPLIVDLVRRALMEHPHHTLPILFALRNSLADRKYLSDKPLPSPSPRILAATQLLEEAMGDPKIAVAVTQMGRYADALINFANQQCHPKRGAYKIPETSPIAHLPELNRVLDPTVKLPPRHNLNYDNIIGIHKFDTVFETVGGVNNPKKIFCMTTDGKRRTLLLKGKDDLRQDAVMQQVFSIINELLLRDPDTSRHKLVVRTYRVQPLSQRSGLIEWCENTQPLGHYLVGGDGQGGAHRRFRPDDLNPMECRKRLAGVARCDPSAKLEMYLDICKQFRPVLHYFFLEKFPTASVWFERRLAYIRSVATSSMIGYILGIGDRHLMNILIDNRTAEAIHIDLGIAFEQGKTLPTPETVPFRLTRDVESGMGCSGVDGVFRSCCERTMATLRANRDTILTLLEVLLYDPLYAWSIIPEKTLSRQGNHSESSSAGSSDSPQSISHVNAMAERALIKLKTKLQGMEQGGVVSTVEGQVSGLIQQARDPSNLCRLFAGWQAYL